MPATRPRQIVRRAVMALAVVVGFFVAATAARQPPEIERSRALHLGMTRAEVEAVMGKEDGGWGEPTGIYFGKSIAIKCRVLDWFDWIGFNSKVPKVRHDDWPVHVRFDEGDRVDLIERNGEPKEEATRVPNSAGNPG